MSIWLWWPHRALNAGTGHFYWDRFQGSLERCGSDAKHHRLQSLSHTICSTIVWSHERHRAAWPGIGGYFSGYAVRDRSEFSTIAR